MYMNEDFPFLSLPLSSAYLLHVGDDGLVQVHLAGAAFRLASHKLGAKCHGALHLERSLFACALAHDTRVSPDFQVFDGGFVAAVVAKAVPRCDWYLRSAPHFFATKILPSFLPAAALVARMTAD